MKDLTMLKDSFSQILKEVESLRKFKSETESGTADKYYIEKIRDLEYDVRDLKNIIKENQEGIDILWKQSNDAMNEVWDLRVAYKSLKAENEILKSK
jgi:hypothetical protein